MKLKFTFFTPLLFIFFSQAFAQGIVNEIKIDTMKKYVSDLSGASSFLLNGNTITITSRNTVHQSITNAERYLKFRFQTYGLSVTEQPFQFNGYNAKNIIAVQEGTTLKNKKLIICAHFDAINKYGGNAPGADDNASGTAAVLEAARILSKKTPQYTIVYALFSGEEQGLRGSWYYAGLANSNQEDIIGVINLDMIAYDNDQDNTVEIYYRGMGEKQNLMEALLRKLQSVNTGYGLGLTVSPIATAGSNSDHWPFIYYTYPALLMIEEMSDFNDKYHEIEDNYAKLLTHIVFYEKCAKLAIISLAELSGAIQVPTKADDIAALPSDLVLSQNYPNPFNPSTVISYSLKEGNNVRLSVFDALGREVKTLVDEYKPAGNHQAIFSVENGSATSGVYFYRLQSGASMLMKKMVYLK